jgi:hypothetical protein
VNSKNIATPVWQSITAAQAAPLSLTPPQDARIGLLRHWLGTLNPTLQLQAQSLRIASADASFRRYFRIDSALADTPSWIVMDAPPPQEDIAPFVAVQALLAQAGLRAPMIKAQDPEQGFLLLGDFGDQTLLEALRTDPAGEHLQQRYRSAITALVRMQSCGPKASASGLPAYDQTLLMRELALYPEWYVARHRGVKLSAPQLAQLQKGFETLVQAILTQPRVTVHRDWHARNLMVLPGTTELGILDFQDAVDGPLTYDLVSLLRDAYISWDDERVLDWAVRYWEQARAAGIAVPPDFGTFWRDFEWMGLQRHLKVLGIFARLRWRDGKERYLADLPRVLRYVTAVAHRYDALLPLARIIDRVEGTPLQAGLTF